MSIVSRLWKWPGCTTVTLLLTKLPVGLYSGGIELIGLGELKYFRCLSKAYACQRIGDTPQKH